MHTTYRPEEVHTTYRPRTRTRTIYYDPPATVYEPSAAYTEPTVSVFPPPSATEAAFKDGLWAGRIESLTIAGLGAYYLCETRDEGRDDDMERKEVYERELAGTRSLMKELKAEYAKTDPLVSAIQRPQSGRYEGRSAEDDDGDQGVVTHLTFRDDGTIDGWGVDAVDGGYVIKEGVWSINGQIPTPADHGQIPTPGIGGRVAWVEKYDEGFEVALRGQVRADGTIRAMWASTIGVSGSVDLVCD